MSEKRIAQKSICPLCNQSNGYVELDRGDFVLVHCSECDLVYAWPFDTSETLYDDAYSSNGEYHYYLSMATKAQHTKFPLTWSMRRFLQTIRPNGELLDIGCSTGGFLLAAKEKGWNINGVELSERAANIAHTLSSAQVWIGSFEKMRIEDSFDAITAWEVLEHSSDPVGFITAAVGLLRPGGVLGLSVPNWRSPWMKRSKEPQHWPPYHLTFWNRTSLGQLFSQVGLNNWMIREKPFAWGEEVGRLKWLYLPVSLTRSVLLGQKGMHLFAMAWKP